MNAIHAPAPAHAVRPFRMLLRREFWEHRGGFLWAPLVAGGITLLFAIAGAIAGTLSMSRTGNRIEIDHATPGDVARALGGVGDVALMGGIGIALVVLGFAVFFYALGALYDDRRDRSVLFWKSLPVSDLATVGSKVMWALLLAPLIAVAAGICIGLAMLAITALTTTVNGVPGGSGVFVHSHPLLVVASVVSLLPLYALWSLPALGWLMLCSAASRSKPFLWATMIPVIGCALASLVAVILRLPLDHERLWYVAYRILLSVFPGTWMPNLEERGGPSIDSPEEIARAVDVASHWSVLGTADLWIGVIAGVAMLALAVRLRRWREEG
jgi:ABC-2 type transport system permease protein